MDETYSLILNSQNTKNSISVNGTNQISYNINWDAVLPRKYNKYSLRWQLQAVSITTTVFQGTTNGTTLTVSMTIAPLAVGNIFIYNAQLFQIIANTGVGTWTLSQAPQTQITVPTIFSLFQLDYDVLAVSINFGKSNAVDQTYSTSNIIGYINPLCINVAPSINAYNYNASFQDNGPIQILYPSNNNITVNFLLLDGVTINTASSFNYILQLSFTPILNQEVINNNNSNLLSGSY